MHKLKLTVIDRKTGKTYTVYSRKKMSTFLSSLWGPNWIAIVNHSDGHTLYDGMTMTTERILSDVRNFTHS